MYREDKICKRPPVYKKRDKKKEKVYEVVEHSLCQRYFSW